jgi:hypothetical protein
VKITIETGVGGAFNAETHLWEQFEAITVTKQEGKGTKRTTTTFAFEGADPEAMCEAAMAYFGATPPEAI